MNRPEALIKNTYTVEFYHATNNLTVCVDVVSTDEKAAQAFARRRFKLESTLWELVGVDKKYELAQP
jgi:hypothetical protein